MSVTYSNYLKIEELLQLQAPRSDKPEHDETLFIIIHQVYELWFKQILHEADYLAELLEEPPAPGAVAKVGHTLKRIRTILKTMVAQVDILETMTPISFSSFRSRLDEASGFQSAQFREFEFVLGHRNRRMVRFHEEVPSAHERLNRRLEEPSLYQSFLGFLRGHGYAIPDEALEPLGDGPPPELQEVRDIFIKIYHSDDRLASLCELLVDLDEGLQEWRYRHVKMVERTIGTKQGTGGSPGAEYLKRTLFKPVFPDLWAIRASL